MSCDVEWRQYVVFAVLAILGELEYANFQHDLIHAKVVLIIH